MNETVKKGLEGALRAAVVSQGEAGNGAAPESGDLVNLIVKALPRFLETMNEREDLSEMWKEDILLLRKEVRLARRQLRELAHQMILISEQQATTNAHLARLFIVDPAVDDDEDDYDEEDYADDLDPRSGVIEASPVRRSATATSKPRGKARQKSRRGTL